MHKKTLKKKYTKKQKGSSLIWDSEAEKIYKIFENKFSKEQIKQLKNIKQIIQDKIKILIQKSSEINLKQIVKKVLPDILHDKIKCDMNTPQCTTDIKNIIPENYDLNNLIAELIKNLLKQTITYSQRHR